MRTAMRQVLVRPFTQIEGYAFSAELEPDAFPESDSFDDPMRSCLILSEDGVDLGPPHTAHQVIGSRGCGGFSHWNGMLQFSSSDGTSPNDNGRVYEARWDVARYFENRANHALAIVRSWGGRFGGLEAFKGERVVEIGPGRDMGTVLIMAALKARSVCAIDRFRGAWQEGWHDQFIAALGRLLTRELPNADQGPLHEALKARDIKGARIVLVSEPFERAGYRVGGADVTVSHSVFEHFYSMPEAAEALVLTSNPGSVGVHNVDFRDHRNFGQPLEFLITPDELYAMRDANDDYGRGNRVRPREMQRLLEGAGFSEVAFLSDQIADAAYVASIEARLQSATSRFRGMRADELSVLSGTFLLRR